MAVGHGRVCADRSSRRRSRRWSCPCPRLVGTAVSGRLRKLSSTSTTPDKRSRSGRTIDRRSLCSHAHAVLQARPEATSCRFCRRDPVLLRRSSEPHRGEPRRQGRARAVEEQCPPSPTSSDRTGYVHNYARPFARCPELPPDTRDTKTHRPTATVPIVNTRLPRRKTKLINCWKSPRIVHPANRMTLDATTPRFYCTQAEGQYACSNSIYAG